MPTIHVHDEAANRTLDLIASRLGELLDEVRGLRKEMDRDREGRERQEQSPARRGARGR